MYEERGGGGLAVYRMLCVRSAYISASLGYFRSITSVCASCCCLL